MSPKAFQALKEKWYKKLADTGFKDIENPKDPNGLLNHPVTRVTQKLKEDLIRGVDSNGCSYAFSPTSQFYSRRLDFLLQHTFSCKGDRFVFEGAAGGLVPAQIWKLMKTSDHYRTHWSYWRVRYSLDKSNKAFREWCENAR